MSQKTIGIVGGGQLGRMLTQAAHSLDFNVVVLDPTPNSPAGQITKQIVGGFKDEAKIRELANESDFITFEVELANSAVLEDLQNSGKIIHPSPATLGIIKNKFGQKQFLRSADIPVADFLEVKTKQDILQAAETFNYPIILKAKFDAYDGRGNALVKSETDVEQAMEKLQARELYVEKFIKFQKELGVTAVRANDGTIEVYPIMETIHKNHICHTVLAPANIEEQKKQQARDLAIQTLKHLHGVGVFCVEMFLAEDGNVLVNEIAPRVHNAGHLTIEASQTSQFENHIRAISGMDLGRTDLKTAAAVMINILGEREGAANFPGFDGTWEDFSTKHQLPKISAEDSTKIFVHIYGKLQTKPERKMGHITVVGNNLEKALAAGQQARKLIEI